MFTGIIEGLGTIREIRSSARETRLAVEADFAMEGTRIGDSVSANGACLTVVRLENRRFTADVSPETLARTTFKKARVGERVNLERAMRFSDRLDGHLVAGHVDGTGQIAGRRQQANTWIVDVTAAPALLRYMIEKGSVAVDGISLTINRLEADRFQVSVIPHTAKLTTIGFKMVGDEVHIETDLIGKYVERFVTGGKAGIREMNKADISMDLLARSGFIK
ncbi:MAG: riboflavin synthase [Desulfobacterales bacterium]|nr:riboflavin synthase [Desulfobacterales bacterium]